MSTTITPTLAMIDAAIAQLHAEGEHQRVDDYLDMRLAYAG